MQLRLLYQSRDRSLNDIIQGYKALLRLLMAVSFVTCLTLLNTNNHTSFHLLSTLALRAKQFGPTWFEGRPEGFSPS